MEKNVYYLYHTIVTASFFAEMGFNPVKCVLFDMDGLLLDTENLYSEGTQKVLSQFGDKVLLLTACS